MSEWVCASFMLEVVAEVVMYYALESVMLLGCRNLDRSRGRCCRSRGCLFRKVLNRRKGGCRVRESLSQPNLRYWRLQT